MSVARNYFNDRRRDRPGFNYRRNERSFGGNIPISRHSIFIRGLPASINSKAVKSFFMDESRSNVLIDFVSYTDDHKKLCIAIRFESHQIAKEIYNKFNNREILGHIVEFSWFKDMKAVKGRYNERRFRDKNYPGRKLRRFNDRSIRSGSRNYRSRSKQRFRDSFDKKKEYKSRSQSRDSATSSSFSKSRSASESLSARSSASPTRLIRNINKHKYKKRNNSDSYVSRGHSRDRSLSKSEAESDHMKKPIRTELDQGKAQSDYVHKVEPVIKVDSVVVKDEVTKVVDSLSSGSVHDDYNKIKIKSTELLDSYSKDIENYLTVINALISTNSALEAPILESMKHVLNEIGENYVYQFLKYIENISSAAISPKC